ncbi:hypothetical protein [Wolbachia endosymbiont (group E) of Neria commutata]|uniref:hypothetical protein n=1 Tax=Wolbachia endosymbiont (group E) of Neria commutata TaxID=3066149 RepID=UPI0031329EAF
MKAGIRINYAQGGKCSFTNCVTEKIGKLEGVKESVKIVSSIICQLTSKGAVFDQNYHKINDALKKSGIFEDHEINLQKATKEFSKHINEFHRIVESAVVQGELKNLETDNTTFFIECSPDSIVDVAKLINGAKSLVESGGGIVKIGQNTLKIEKNNGITNYSNLLGNGRVVLTLKGLEITLYCDAQNKGRMIVEVSDNDMEMINRLSDETKKEMFGNYLLEGIPLCNAIKQGYCERSVELQFSETISFPEKVMKKASELITSLEDSGSNIDTPTNWRNKIRTESGKGAAVVKG